jgi:hypothetical protein
VTLDHTLAVIGTGTLIGDLSRQIVATHGLWPCKRKAAPPRTMNLATFQSDKWRWTEQR